MKYSVFIRPFFILFFCFSFVSPLFSAIEDNPFNGDVVDAVIPVDGGILSVTLMAVAYGIKRHKENKDKSE